MTPALVALVLKVGLLTWLGLLMAIIVGRMMRGNMTTRGLLSHDAQHAGTETNPTRAIAMLVFPLVLMFLVLEGLNFDPSAVPQGARPNFPDIPENLLLLLTGGNGVYLAGKMASSNKSASINNGVRQ